MRFSEEMNGVGPQIIPTGRPGGPPQVAIERALIFVHIQKTGGVSILNALGGEMHPGYTHRFASEFRNEYGEEVWDQAYKFAFVRNPWDRLVSWWSMINQFRGAYARGAKFNRFYTYILDNGRTFTDFILNCGADIEDAYGNKCIFRNQLDYITDTEGKIIVDYVGRFETLAKDFQKLARRLQLPDATLEHKKRSHRKPYTAYYTADTRAVVADAYARDIARFGYVFDCERN